MSLKTTGAEIKAFWQLEAPWWPFNGYVDGDSYEVNGEPRDDSWDPSMCDDTDQIKIISGVICEDKGDDEKDLVSTIKKWRKSLTMVRVVVEIHKDELPAFKREMKAYGAKIVS